MDDNTIVHPTSHNRAHLINLFVFKGHPVNNDQHRQVQILVNQGYVAGFCPDRLQPVWVGYRVAGFDRDVDFDRPHLYYDDHRLNPSQRIGTDVFGTHDNIQYHVGHMVPNEVINRQFGRLAQMETFFMSNMSPQRGTLNSGVWRELEDKIRSIKDTKQNDHVWVINGPIFDNNPKTIARPRGLQVPIPIGYYCITVDPFRYPWDLPSNVTVAYFIIPQDAAPKTPVRNFLSSREEIEAATNLSFFPDWRSDGVTAAPARSPSNHAPEARHRLLRQL